MRDKKRITLPALMLFDQALTATDLHVMGILSYHWSPASGLSAPSRHHIARLINRSEAQASRSLSSLARAGWISRSRLTSDSRLYGYKIHWNYRPDLLKVSDADVIDIPKVSDADVTDIPKVSDADVTDPKSLEISDADVTDFASFEPKTDLTPLRKNNYTSVDTYISIKTCILGKLVQWLTEEHTELAQLPVDGAINRASEAVEILQVFGVPPNYLTIPSRRNIYQAWMNRGTTFRQLIDACLTALRRRAEDQDIRPIGVAYVDRILTNKPNHEDIGAAAQRAEEAFLSG